MDATNGAAWSTHHEAKERMHCSILFFEMSDTCLCFVKSTEAMCRNITFYILVDQRDACSIIPSNDIRHFLLRRVGRKTRL